MRKLLYLTALVMVATSAWTKNDDKISGEYVDLGLPSKTKWKSVNEMNAANTEIAFYTYDEAVSRFDNRLPTESQWKELKSECQWLWNGSGYKVTGPNGNSIMLPASGYRLCGGSVRSVGSFGFYWSSSPFDSDSAYELYFGSREVGVSINTRCLGRSVRLVQNESKSDAIQVVAREKQVRSEAQKRRAAKFKAQGWVDLGLPSGTLWKERDETGTFYTYDQAINKFGNSLPSREKFKELKKYCIWTWNGSGYNVTGPSGDSIVLPAMGYCYWSGGRVIHKERGSSGHYWSSKLVGSNYPNYAFCFDFDSDGVDEKIANRSFVYSVRLAQDSVTIQAEQLAKQQAKQREEQARREAQERRVAQLKAQGWVDLGLPSGTLWKENEEDGFYTYVMAVKIYGKNLPTKKQFEELGRNCSWTWLDGIGYQVTGPNGNSIVLPASGYRRSDGRVDGIDKGGSLWTLTPSGSQDAYSFSFGVGGVSLNRIYQNNYHHVYLTMQVQSKAQQGYVDLGLPSGTFWKATNESKFYTYDEAVTQFGSRLPTKQQWEELKTKCRWTWNGSGYQVTGPNGNSIVLPASGYNYSGTVDYVGYRGLYWSFTREDLNNSRWYLQFNSSGINMNSDYRHERLSVRLVQE